MEAHNLHRIVGPKVLIGFFAEQKVHPAPFHTARLFDCHCHVDFAGRIDSELGAIRGAKPLQPVAGKKSELVTDIDITATDGGKMEAAAPKTVENPPKILSLYGILEHPRKSLGQPLFVMDAKELSEHGFGLRDT